MGWLTTSSPWQLGLKSRPNALPWWREPPKSHPSSNMCRSHSTPNIWAWSSTRRNFADCFYWGLTTLLKPLEIDRSSSLPKGVSFYTGTHGEDMDHWPPWSIETAVEQLPPQPTNFGIVLHPPPRPLAGRLTSALGAQSSSHMRKQERQPQGRA